MDSEFIKSTLLMLTLLNPFLLFIYLLDIIRNYTEKDFKHVLIRAGLISFVIFLLFSIVGEQIFTRVFQARYASFQIFGGMVFLSVGFRLVFQGNSAFRALKGSPQHIAGAIAMPIMVGPATVSASILAGEKLNILLAAFSIFLAISVSVLVMILLKHLHDYVQPRKERLVERYVEIMGRITALFVGTFSIDMIMKGLYAWINQF